MTKFAVFIDRDGTINEEVGYVDSFDRFRILPGVPEAIQRLNENNIPVIVITNQSGIARGYFPAKFVDDLHGRMIEEFAAQNCRIDGIYICPHHPDDGCACRKPKPGMLLRAAKELGVTLHKSFVIGDKILDIKTAHSVGAKGILVMTGYGAEEIKSVNRKIPPSPLRLLSGQAFPFPEGEGYHSDKPEHVAANLKEAIAWIIEEALSNEQQTMCTKEDESSLPFMGRERVGMVFTGKANSRILIVKPSSLGDIIHSLPVLWAVRKTYPDAYIGWVVKEVWQDVLFDNPLIDHLIILKKGVGGIITAIRETRSMRFDTIIDLQGLFRSGIISFLSGAEERIGFSNAKECAHLFYNKKVQVQSDQMHAVDRYMLTVSALPCPQFPPNPPLFPLYIAIEDAEWAKGFLQENNLNNKTPLIAINPSARWLKKRWPAESYSALINQLIKEMKAGIIILGGEEDIPVAEKIKSLVPDRIAIATGKTTIKRLAAILKRVNILVTNDSGPMHLAAALGTKVVALFGPTNPALTGPYGDGHIVIYNGMDCSPCFRRPCKHGRPVCMEMITPEQVMKAVKDLSLKEIKWR